MTIPLIALLVAQAASPSPAPPPPTAVRTSAGEVRIETLATLELPWGMAWLPDGRLLVTEKPGRLRIFAGGTLSEPVAGVPQVAFRGTQRDQGGLLDVAVDPAFEKNSLVYLSYTEAAAEQPAGLRDTPEPRFGGSAPTDHVLKGGAVARGKLSGNRLTDVKVIWRQEPKTIGRGHYGHRLVFAPDGKLFVTSGDRMRFDPAQAMDTNLGKVVRINPDGSDPADNPFAAKKGGRGDVYSVGHRNVLAAAVHPVTGRLWVVEMGPKDGDELNLVEPGRNYGWPVVSNGDNYDDSPIPDHPTRPEFEAPVRTWTPVISPSGALFYTGSLFPGWKGSLLVGGLSSKAIVRVPLDGSRAGEEERIEVGRRIRDVIEAPDGALLAIVDDPRGDLLRIAPARPAAR